MGEVSESTKDQPYDILEDTELLEDIIKYNGEDQDDRQDN